METIFHLLSLLLCYEISMRERRVSVPPHAFQGMSFSICTIAFSPL
jgi:hypothetical protein